MSGKTDAINFAQFTNLAANGQGSYFGSSVFPNNGTDFISIASNTQSGNGFNVNLPIGVLVQPDPHFAFVIHSGYSAPIAIPSSGSTEVEHFIPVGLDLIVTPNKQVDIGLSFARVGLVASSNGNSPGYTDIFNAALWLRRRNEYLPRYANLRKDVLLLPQRSKFPR